MCFFITVFLLYLCDQTSKFLIVSWMNPGESVPVVKNFFNVTYIRNSGTIFGFFQQYTAILTILSAIALIAIVVLFVLFSKKDRTLYLSCILIAGGALGNLSDRIRWGYVVDFLDFHLKGWHWPAFNCADVAITAGIILILFSIVKTELKKGKQTKKNFKLSEDY